MLQLPKPSQPSKSTKPLVSLSESYEFCRQVTAEYSKTFYLASLLIPKEKRRAIWAIYAWCRRTDELVDGLKSRFTTPETLKLWEKQLESVFAGYAVDDADVALVDTVKKFSMKIYPFRDMIAGQLMDLHRSRYETFEELDLYCYRVAGTVGLMTTDIIGLESNELAAPWEKDKPYDPSQEAIALGMAMQLTNILRDVGEDAQRGRIYLPLEDLKRFNYTEDDLMKGVVDDRWRALMRFQIQRAREYYNKAEKGIRYLIPDSRWPIWAALMFYQGILDAIERNQYDVFTKRAFVSKGGKVVYLPISWLKAQVL
jgi:15-cis-phytoene synthase